MPFNNYLLNKKYYDLLYKFNPLTKSTNKIGKNKRAFLCPSILIHLAFHKLEEALLNPELFLLLLNGKRNF